MQKSRKCHNLISLILLATIFTCCEKQKLPVVTTNAVSSITSTSATSGGNITDEGSSTVTARGVCWSTNTTPTVTDNKTSDGAGAGSYSSAIKDLFGGTTYFVRAYAINDAGTAYGMALSFQTTGQPPSAPVVSAQNASNIQTTSAQLNGTVNAMFYSTVVTFEYGTTTNYGTSISATQSPVSGNNSTNVSVSISGLVVGTTYHYRIKAVNSLGTTYSNDISFKTLGQAPTVTTQAATNRTTVGAQLNGTVNANYISTVVTFEYGTTTSYGNSITATQSPVTGNSNTAISATLTGLNVATTYHYRIVAINSLGTTNGGDMTFTTLGQVPSATTQAATNRSTTGAQLNGLVNANYLSTSITFEYGTTISYGNTVTAIQSPLSGNANTNVNANVTGLVEGSSYHYRVTATNSLGTTNGNDMTFNTLGQVPSATVLAATLTTPTGAQLNGTVNANYLESTVSFEYGTTTSYGNTVAAQQSPVSGSTVTNVSANVIGLTYGSVYHYRVKAVNSLGTSYSNDMQFTAAYTIGENIYGGIIFYIDVTGQHGLLCATSDQSTFAEWGCMYTDLTGANGTTVGSGYQNTLDIINGCTTAVAAKICYDLNLNGYTDWFLPSRGELSLMYVNLKALNGLGNFADVFYWSSTEDSNNFAFCQLFTGTEFTGVYKTNKCYVRAIRAF